MPNLCKEVEYEIIWSFFTPKLTSEEMRLVQQRNEEYLKTDHDHLFGLNPDIDVEEMKKSDSKAKYFHGRCQRKTTPLTLATRRLTIPMLMIQAVNFRGQIQIEQT